MGLCGSGQALSVARTLNQGRGPQAGQRAAQVGEVQTPVLHGARQDIDCQCGRAGFFAVRCKARYQAYHGVMGVVGSSSTFG